eukprot:TRINITY_DN10139_c0_g1_i11.p1 TRINITY_DN10139_c0_g1~~TRINITY_DN10139_c0_g1_i11.p1  ORF type:complete len:947 (+),score=168.02 TRINITY_DN10139_c0_g1_i11:89-2842(+)
MSWQQGYHAVPHDPYPPPPQNQDPYPPPPPPQQLPDPYPAQPPSYPPSQQVQDPYPVPGPYPAQPPSYPPSQQVQDPYPVPGPYPAQPPSYPPQNQPLPHVAAYPPLASQQAPPPSYASQQSYQRMPQHGGPGVVVPLFNQPPPKRRGAVETCALWCTLCFCVIAVPMFGYYTCYKVPKDNAELDRFESLEGLVNTSTATDYRCHRRDACTCVPKPTSGPEPPSCSDMESSNRSGTCISEDVADCCLNQECVPGTKEVCRRDGEQVPLSEEGEVGVTCAQEPDACASKRCRQYGVTECTLRWGTCSDIHVTYNINAHGFYSPVARPPIHCTIDDAPSCKDGTLSQYPVGSTDTIWWDTDSSDGDVSGIHWTEDFSTESSSSWASEVGIWMMVVCTLSLAVLTRRSWFPKVKACWLACRARRARQKEQKEQEAKQQQQQQQQQQWAHNSYQYPQPNQPQPQSVEPAVNVYPAADVSWTRTPSGMSLHELHPEQNLRDEYSPQNSSAVATPTGKKKRKKSRKVVGSTTADPAAFGVPDATPVSPAEEDPEVVAVPDGADSDGGEESEASDANTGLEYNADTVLMGRVLGIGGFGVVCHGTHMVSQEQLAVKKIANPAACASLQAELKLLQRLHHARIVLLKGFAITEGEGGSELAIYMEYVGGGSLHDVMKARGGRLIEDSIRRLLKDAVLGLRYLHGQDVVHRDIKPANLLVDGHGRVKLADFGCCKENVNTMQATAVAGTPNYLSPEGVHGRVSIYSDIWAIGCTVVELASGRLPWHETGRQGVPLMLYIAEGAGNEAHRPRIPDVLSPLAQVHVAKCLAAMPDDRFTCDELLASQFFADVGKPLPEAESLKDYSSAISSKNTAVGSDGPMQVYSIMSSVQGVQSGQASQQPAAMSTYAATVSSYQPVSTGAPLSTF